MTIARSSIDHDGEPFGPAFVKRGLNIRFFVRDQSATTEAFARKDISAARWTYRLRVWTSDDDVSALVDEALTKGTDSASGEIDHYHSCGATVYADRLRWEIVEVDNDNADATTTSTFREVPKMRWSQPIVDAP